MKKILEFVCLFFTIILFVEFIATYIIDKQNTNWVCGPVLIILNLILLPTQIFINYRIFKSKTRQWKIILLVFSVIITIFLLWNFENFLTKCS